ncbi:MAG: chromate efflux transporter [Bacteroidota bacterium]
MQKFKQVRLLVYLLDVLKLAVTAFGGPQMHFTQFHKILVLKRNYLGEEELKEINSLCSMLPGPTSTQTITAIGYKIGGPSLAFITLFIWVLPASILMTAFAFIVTRFSIENPKLHFLKFIQPMAVGFIIFAAYKIKNLFVTRIHHWILMVLAAVLAIFLKTPYVFPVLLLVGGFVSTQVNKANYRDVKPIKNINWSNFFLFLGIFLLAALLGALTGNKAFLLFENTYRFGSLVFGGGHVLIPMMYNQFVEFKHYLQPDSFIAGVGILQAIPGPVFSISTFAGALALNDWGLHGLLLGAFIGTTAIFLPGILLIFFIYPIWAQVKNYSPIKHAIEGINATSAGLVVASAYLLFEPIEINEANMLALLATLFLLLTTRLPNPVMVIICITAGFLF